MIEIDRIEPSFTLDLVDDEMGLVFHFRDAAGTVRKAFISSSAVHDLADKLRDAQTVLIGRLTPTGNATSITLTTGPTREEVYSSEGEL